jgi:hypothetical protein
MKKKVNPVLEKIGERIITLQDFQEWKLVEIDDGMFFIECNMIGETLPIYEFKLISLDSKIKINHENIPIDYIQKFLKEYNVDVVKDVYIETDELNSPKFINNYINISE